MIRVRPLAVHSHPSYVFSGPHAREAKGIKDGIKVFELMYDGYQPREPKKIRHSDLRNPKTLQNLKKAIESEYKGDWTGASYQYDFVLNDDPLHFAANCRKAALLHKRRKELRANLRDILEHGSRAEESFPESGFAKAQRLVAEWALNPEPEGGGKRFALDQLNTFIDQARAAVESARNECDLYGEIVALNVKAYFLALRFSESKLILDYNEALDACTMIEVVTNDIEKRWLPAFYDTYANVLSHAPDRESLDRAYEFAEKSHKLRPSPLATETMTRVLRKKEKEGY